MTQTKKQPKVGRFQTYDKPELIKTGADGIVGKISDRGFAKIPRVTNQNIGREMAIAKKLYEVEAPIPTPFGWDNVRFPYLEMCKAFISRFTGGMDGYRLLINGLNEEYDFGEELAEIEYEKLRRLDFRTRDSSNPGNWILSPDKKKVTLVDFAGWSHPDVPETSCGFENGIFIVRPIIDPESVFDETWMRRFE